MRLNLKLKSVTLENFRLFEKLEMDFHPQMTVLIGENGAGKTALVEGITKQLQIIPISINNPNFHFEVKLKEVYSTKDIRDGQPHSKCSIILKSSSDAERKDKDLDASQNLSERIIPSEIELSKQHLYNQSILQTELTELFRFIRVENTSSQRFSIPILVYYPCEKVDNEPENGQKRDYPEHDIFNAYENALNARAFDFPRFFEWFKWQEDREARGQGSKTLEIVRKAILSMLNEEGEEEKFTHIFVDVSSFSNYHLKLKKGEAELEVSQLSSGEKSLFALVSDIARRLAIANPGSDDPLSEGGGIVFIDEIDLHLHPRWQRKVIRKLTETFPNLQFIITTHSPLILGSVRSENIRLLDEGKVYSVPETFGQNVGVIIKRIMGVEESLFEEEIRQIFRLLTKNQVEEAKKKIAEIESKSPADIPALREAKAVLKRKEILAG